MSLAIIEFIGSPTSGKSTLSKALHQNLLSRNILSHLCSNEIIVKNHLKRRLKVPYNLLTMLIVFVISVYSLFSLKLYSVGLKKGKGYLKWLNRLRNELNNSIKWRKIISETFSGNKIIISDAKILGKCLFEIGDPRNIIGFALLPIIMKALQLLPSIDIEHIFIIVADSQHAIRRESRRKVNRVRPFLLPYQRKEYFYNSEKLSYMVYKSFGYKNKISLIHTSNSRIETSLERILAQLNYCHNIIDVQK